MNGLRYRFIMALLFLVIGAGCKKDKNEKPPMLHQGSLSLKTGPSSQRLLPRNLVVADKRAPWLQVFRSTPPPVGSYKMVSLPKTLPVLQPKKGVEQQPVAWKIRMKQAGARFKQAGVLGIVLVHGTFVGDDPMGLVGWLETMLPKSWRPFLQRLRKLINKTQGTITKDMGNFVAPYERLLQGALGISCSRFRWSSENHHEARSKAALRLVDFLIKRLPTSSLSRSQRLLLVGHSHAGQVFALLTHLLAKSKEVPVFLRAMKVSVEQQATLQKKLKRLRKISIDILTLGTPPRYAWAIPARSGVRLLHIINHRGATPRGGALHLLSMGRVLATRDGDYVQQWGIAGSDVPTPLERNKALVPLLGPSFSPIYWDQARKLRTRVHTAGFNLLVDYRDGFVLTKPSEWFTLLGHGIYTRYSTMLFWVETVQQRWFPKKP